MPKITVLMSVFNGETYLRQAIESILIQTFTDYEFLVINDASTDSSVDIIKSYDDLRIKLINNETNFGLTKSLNIGLRYAQGEYIARMDCDDISLPERLAKQAEFMDTHPEIGICGSWVKTIGATRNEIWQFPTDPEMIKCRLLFKSALAHPSVIMRKTQLGKNSLLYNEMYRLAQDYDLWARAIDHFKFANIGEVLIYYRIHGKGNGSKFRSQQVNTANFVRELQLKKLDAMFSKEELKLHQRISIPDYEPSQRFIDQSNEWLIKLKNINGLKKVYLEPIFSEVLSEYWFAVCYSSSMCGLWTWRKFWQSPLSGYNKINLKKMIKFFIKCLLQWRKV